MSSLSLVLKAEKNVIYLLLGRRTIKKLVRRTVGNNGAELVDQCYKLAGITLGKRPAKKFIQSVLNVIAEISVLTMHGRLKEVDLQVIRRCICTLANQFKEIHTTKESDFRSFSRMRSDEALKEIKRTFVREVRRTESGLISLLQAHCQPSTLKRLQCISKTLRDPQIVNICFQKSDSDVAFLIQELIGTSEKIEQDQAEKYSSRSRSQSKSKSKKSQRIRL